MASRRIRTAATLSIHARDMKTIDNKTEALPMGPPILTSVMHCVLLSNVNITVSFPYLNCVSVCIVLAAGIQIESPCWYEREKQNGM
jgi:hypothetical protein